MIHLMRTASIRALRTQFPKVRRAVEQEGEVVVTDRGTPILLLQPYRERARPWSSRIDYYARLVRRMPRPLSAAARKALDEENCGER
jgi:prevent-host-death family protein